MFKTCLLFSRSYTVDPYTSTAWIQEQLLSRNVEQFRGELVVKAHRLLHHSTLDSGVIKKKRRLPGGGEVMSSREHFQQSIHVTFRSRLHCLEGEEGWFINSQTRTLGASEEYETRRQGSASP